MINCDKDKVKLKHILNMYTLYKEYPTPEDILYFTIKWSINRNKDVVNFTNMFLYKKLGEEHKETIDTSLNILVERGDICLKKIKENRKSYQLIKNPYSDAV